jgi:hypothetical protein
MDPDANVREQERIRVFPPSLRTRDQRDRLRELREALRDWIAGGGFHPSIHTWQECPRTARAYGMATT